MAAVPHCFAPSFPVEVPVEDPDVAEPIFMLAATTRNHVLTVRFPKFIAFRSLGFRVHILTEDSQMGLYDLGLRVPRFVLYFPYLRL